MKNNIRKRGGERELKMIKEKPWRKNRREERSWKKERQIPKEKM